MLYCLERDSSALTRIHLVSSAGGDSYTALDKASVIWMNINGQVLLLVFLPGLIFLDAFTLNVHLFFQSFWQLMTFAFPMVLGGTTLTALFAYYVLVSVLDYACLSCTLI